MVHEVRKAVDEGILDKIQVSNDVDEWCVRMERDGSYVDHTFIEMSARILDSDIVVVSLHGNASGPGHVIRAGLLDGSESARARPHNCNAHQSEGRVGIFKDYLQMQVVSAPCAF